MSLESSKNPSNDVLVMVYYIIKGERKISMKNTKKNYTLNQIGNALFKFIDTTNKRFDNLEVRMDRLETRMDRLETRLDYLVKANNLKDLPKNR